MGPGSYDVRDTNRGKSFKISGKQKDERREDSPPPGKYNPNFDYSKSKVNCMVDYQRSPDRNSSNTNSPGREMRNVGPGSYDSSQFQTAKGGYTFSKLERVQEKNDSPGPGGYNVPCKFADVPDYSPGYKRNVEFKYVGK